MIQTTPQSQTGVSDGITDEMVEAAAKTYWEHGDGHDRDWTDAAIYNVRESTLSAIRAALLAAERLRAPVGGDGKTDREILAEEWERVGDKGQADHLRDYTSPNVWSAVALAAMARARAIPDGWRPIETAPKDGTEIIIWSADDKFQLVASYQEYPFPGRSCWLAHNAPEGSCFPSYVTHWMPLPAAPTLPIAKGETP